ncbi:NDR1/HIN1-like protein 13 [Gastrolobium bilobum]|uniref:NDR1/HIN1-like protein 13 n=1 Tax=Gastrolobium bilobum TaxID=150636 RepID=UPI002AB0FC92|nr:NDR1/HIN1-like protein 13 [Gastrolobium bilobum]
MEERDPPPHYANNSHSSKPKLPNIDPGTYVVHVPKDQIYRVPPPENARIAENYRNPPSRDTKQTRCWCFVLIIVFIAIVIFIGGLLGGLFSIVLTPKDPRFSIQRFLLETTPHPKYNITLQVYNPNSKVDISYKEGGVVSLSLRRQGIASGAYPTFHQPHHNSTVFGVALKGSKAGFPKEVDESMKSDTNKVHVAFSLTIHVLARMRMGLLRSGTMKYDVTCQLLVDTLAKTTTRVLSQQCQTKRH